MEKKRVFIFEKDGLASQYGIGKYIDILFYEFSKNDFFDYVFIRRDTKVDKITITKEGIISILQIPYPLHQYRLNFTSCLALYCLLDDILDFSSSDIFHFNDVEFSPLISILKDNANPKIIYVIHVLLWQIFFKNDYQSFLDSWDNKIKSNSRLIGIIKDELNICNLSDKIISLNEQSKKFAENFYKIKPTKVEVIPNGIYEDDSIDTEHLAVLKENLSITNGEKIILFVGRLENSKGVKRVIESFIGLLKLRTDTCLILVGNGDFNEIIPYSYGIWKFIKIIGYLPPPEIKSFYKLADILVLPSMSEQSSYTILEALSFRTPIVITDIPGFNFLTHNINAIKLSNNYPNSELVVQLNNLLNNEQLRLNISENGYNLFKKKYTSKTMVNSILKIYGNDLRG